MPRDNIAACLPLFWASGFHQAMPLFILGYLGIFELAKRTRLSPNKVRHCLVIIQPISLETQIRRCFVVSTHQLVNLCAVP